MVLVWLVFGAIKFPCCYFFYTATAPFVIAGDSQSPKYLPDKHQTIVKKTQNFQKLHHFFKNRKPP